MSYLAPDDFRTRVHELADRAGTRAARSVIGTTVEGRPIDAVRVAAPGRTPDRAHPQAFVLAGMHGVEVIGTQLALAVLAEVCAPEPTGAPAQLLDRADVEIVPCLNVDGRTRSIESLTRRGPVAGAPRRNANRVDLNRNWPFPGDVVDHWLPISGTRVRWLPWYRGRGPLSEPETAALARLLEEETRPFALLNLHSTGSILTYPWSSKDEAPADQEGFQRMVDAFTSAQPHHTYRSKQSRAWYPIIGSSNDWFYDRLGALAMTVETSPPGLAVRRDLRRAGRFFWYANPDDPQHWIDNDLPGCFAALLAAHDHRYGAHRPTGLRGTRPRPPDRWPTTS